MTDTFAFIGLGNPGVRYERTRHNIGFRVIDAMASRFRIRMTPTGDLFQAASAVIETRSVTLVQPMTYMNRSGRAVMEVCRRYNLTPADIVIIYDDAHLPFGTIRMRGQGSDGGHNGMKSIIETLGTEAFPRQRIGVGSPRSVDLVDYVLESFGSEEEDCLPAIIDHACEQLGVFLKEGLNRAASYYNRAISLDS